MRISQNINKPLYRLLQAILPDYKNIEPHAGKDNYSSDCPLCHRSGTFTYTFDHQNGEKWSCSACNQHGSYQDMVKILSRRNPLNKLGSSRVSPSPANNNSFPPPSDSWRNAISNWIECLPTWEDKKIQNDKFLNAITHSLNMDPATFARKKAPVFYNPAERQIIVEDEKIIIPKGIIFVAKDQSGLPLAVRVWTLSRSNRLVNAFLKGSAPALCILSGNEFLQKDLTLVIDIFSEIQALHLAPIEDRVVATWWNIPPGDNRRAWLTKYIPNNTTNIYLLSSALASLKIELPKSLTRESLMKTIMDVENFIFLSNVQDFFVKQGEIPLFIPPSRLVVLNNDNISISR